MFRKDWVIINLSHVICDATVESWLRIAGVPNCFSFTFNNSAQIVTYPWYDATWPWGTEPYTIVIHDYDDPNYPKGTNGAVGGNAGDKCSIAYRNKADSTIEMGARIWHEMLHAIGSDPDQMDGKDRVSFCEWVSQNRYEINSTVKSSAASWCLGMVVSPMQYQQTLCAYYTFLTKKANPDCYKKESDGEIQDAIARFVSRVLAFMKSIFGKIRI